jgi:hypothetical protein
VLVLGELALNLGPDTECRRVGAQTLREIPLQRLQLPKQLVVLGVRQGWTVENVVLVGCAIEDGAQLGGAVKLWPLGRLTTRLLWGVSRDRRGLLLRCL